MSKQYIIHGGFNYLEAFPLSPLFGSYLKLGEAGMGWTTTSYKVKAHRFDSKAEALFVMGDREMKPAWVWRDPDTQILEVPHE